MARAFEASDLGFTFGTEFDGDLALASCSSSSLAYNLSFAKFDFGCWTGSGGTNIEGGIAFTPMDGARTLAEPPRLKISMSSSLSSESSPPLPDIEF